MGMAIAPMDFTGDVRAVPPEKSTRTTSARTV